MFAIGNFYREMVVLIVVVAFVGWIDKRSQRHQSVALCGWVGGGLVLLALLDLLAYEHLYQAKRDLVLWIGADGAPAGVIVASVCWLIRRNRLR